MLLPCALGQTRSKEAWLGNARSSTRKNEVLSWKESWQVQRIRMLPPSSLTSKFFFGRERRSTREAIYVDSPAAYLTRAKSVKVQNLPIKSLRIRSKCSICNELPDRP